MCTEKHKNRIIPPKITNLTIMTSSESYLAQCRKKKSQGVIKSAFRENVNTTANIYTLVRPEIAITKY